MAEFQYTNLDRCCHLIFDDADQTFETHDSEVAAIMTIYKAVHLAHKDLIDQGGNSIRKILVCVLA